MTLRSNGRLNPLIRSPISLRSRRNSLPPISNNTIHTPPGSLTKSQKPIRKMDVDKSEIRPEYHTISYEIRALAKMVYQELGNNDENTFNGAPLFERGRFYDEYSARRNERLKRKKKGEVEKKSGYDLGVRADTSKKRETGRRMTVAVATSTPRYSLRSSTVKENKKPPLPLGMMSVEKSVGIGERKMGTRSGVRKK